MKKLSQKQEADEANEELEQNDNMDSEDKEKEEKSLVVFVSGCPETIILQIYNSTFHKQVLATPAIFFILNTLQVNN